jgi:hypothetical protein
MIDTLYRMSEPVVKIKRFSRSKRPVDEEETAPAPQLDITPEPMPETDSHEDFHEDDGFLDDLKVGGRELPPVEEIPPPPPLKRSGGGRKKKVPESGGNEFMHEYGDLFSEKPTPILGKNRRELLTRLSEYRTLFPKELKDFKVKPNATDAQLQDALDEAETVVSCNGVGTMLNEAILTAIQTMEAVSSRTERFDITGTAEALRANPEFARLTKLIWIKHRVFSNAPPEAQLMLVVASTAMIMRQRNVKRREIDGLLDRQI